MKVRATAECPQGQMPGEVFDVTPEVADVFVKVGCAEIVPDSTPLGKPSPKGTHKRRDLVAESR